MITKNVAAYRYSNKLVSVVIPIYNKVEYLAEAIDSVIAQTYKDWEIIAIDDGSTDGSYDLADEYKKRYPGKIRLFRHPGGVNLGCARSRLLGIRISQGEYIANLDADDTFDRGKLEYQVNILAQHPEILLTFSPMILGDDPKTVLSCDENAQRFEFDTPRIFRREEFLPYLLNFKNDPGGCMFRREALVRHMCYTEGIDFCEDTAAYVKLAYRGSVYVGNIPNYFYRQSTMSWCANAVHSGKFYKLHYPFLVWSVTFLFSRKCFAISIWKTLAMTALKYMYRDLALRLKCYANSAKIKAASKNSSIPKTSLN